MREANPNPVAMEVKNRVLGGIKRFPIFLSTDADILFEIELSLNCNFTEFQLLASRWFSIFSEKLLPSEDYLLLLAAL